MVHKRDCAKQTRVISVHVREGSYLPRTTVTPSQIWDVWAPKVATASASWHNVYIYKLPSNHWNDICRSVPTVHKCRVKTKEFTRCTSVFPTPFSGLSSSFGQTIADSSRNLKWHDVTWLKFVWVLPSKKKRLHGTMNILTLKQANECKHY